MSRFFQNPSQSSIEDEDEDEDESSRPEGAETELINAGSSASVESLARLGTSNTHMDLKQQSMLLYVSLIEDRCAEKASKSLGLPRDNDDVRQLTNSTFTAMIQELEKTGALPPGCSQASLEGLRRQYLSIFDGAITDVMTKKLQEGFQSSDALSLLPSFPTALTTLNSFPISIPTRAGRLEPYAAEYEQICRLGKGGFGTVYKVRNLIDNQKYAMKRIVIKADQLRRMHDKDPLQALLAEVRALAQLEHDNIVKYFHGWIEQIPSGSRAETVSDSSSDGSITSTDQSDSHMNFSSPAYEDYSNPFAHSHSSVRQDVAETSVSQNALIKRPNYLDRPSIIDEEVPWSGNQMDYILYIKMKLHPMTLEDYLWPNDPDQQMEHERPTICHCYHSHNSAAILLKVLDGIEYIHDQGYVHRDIKPSNIFISTRDYSARNFSGSVEVTQCVACNTRTDLVNCSSATNVDATNDRLAKRTFITPHIGDFGLVAKLGDSHDNSHSTSSDCQTALAELSLRSGQPGTKFYRSRDRNISPKLDVYSLGIVALELSYSFTTKSERSMVLNKLSTTGEFPDGFEKLDMADGIKKMLCVNEKDRWTCEQVREWLKGIVEKWEKQRVC